MKFLGKFHSNFICSKGGKKFYMSGPDHVTKKATRPSINSQNLKKCS